MLAGKVLSGTQTNRWHPWVDTAGAQAMPGAVACLNHIADLGVEVFYVTNRTRSTSYQATVENLKKLGFPMVDDEHLFLREGTGSKEARFAQVAKDHEVVCYLGDSAGDWPLQTDGLDQAGRNAIIDQRAAAFGTKYIVLPNPAYGAWESVLPHEADGRRNALHIWQPAQ
jgi:5'-nucleotidase (lipoprotein e(P4) family)